jgi:hypothetical protein
MLDQIIATALVLMLGLYGSVMAPPANFWIRSTVRTGTGLAVLWMIILVIVAATPRPPKTTLFETTQDVSYTS